MTDALAAYLQDHLARSHFTVELLELMQDQYRNEPLGNFALAICDEVKRDQNILQEIAEHLGTPSPDPNHVTSLLPFKRDEAGGSLGTFRALEALALGIREKFEFWQVLPLIREVDARVPDYDFEELSARADEQYIEVERQRLHLAPAVFSRTCK